MKEKNRRFEIKNTQWCRKFVRFLKEHNAYAQYVNNIQSLSVSHPNNVDFENEHLACFFLAHSFIWVTTIEGEDFWLKLNYLWMKVWCNATDEVLGLFASNSDIRRLNLNKLSINERKSV